MYIYIYMSMCHLIGALKYERGSNLEKGTAFRPRGGPPGPGPRPLKGPREPLKEPGPWPLRGPRGGLKRAGPRPLRGPRVALKRARAQAFKKAQGGP